MVESRQMQKENEDPISLELCEFCGKFNRKGHLLKHQRSTGCIKKAKTPAELGNRSILDYFKTVSDLKTLFLPIAETGLIICTLNVIKF